MYLLMYLTLQHSFAGLGVLLIDYLASSRVDGYAKEVDIAADLRLSQKNIRKVLRYLESERLVTAETVKFAFKRRNAEEIDDPEVEERKRHETHVFWCVDYPRMVDAIRLRIHRIRETLRHQAFGDESVQRYHCPRCGAQYSSLNAISLLDAVGGIFRCEDCGSELVESEDGAPRPRGANGIDTQKQAGNGDFPAGSSRRERRAYFKELLNRFDMQLKPITDQLERLKDVTPPDYGSLQDWVQAKREEAARRAKRLEDARKKVAAGEGAVADLTEEQLLEWAEKAEVVVALPGAPSEGAEGVAFGASKELPAWFRLQREAGEEEGPSTSVDGGGASTAAAMAALGVEEQRRQLEKQYLEQYLRQVRASQAALEQGGMADDKEKEKNMVGATAGIKIEPGGVADLQIGAKVENELVRSREVVGKEEDVAREDAGVFENNGQDGDEMEWEDAV